MLKELGRFEEAEFLARELLELFPEAGPPHEDDKKLLEEILAGKREAAGERGAGGQARE